MKLKTKIKSASVMIRPEGFNDTNDCSVRATAIATGCDYAVVHKFFKQRGRKDGEGIYYMQIFRKHKDEMTKVMNSYFTELPVTKRNCTFKRFIDWYNTGTFIIRVSGHALCIKDGVVLDGNTVCNRHILNIIQVFKKS